MQLVTRIYSRVGNSVYTASRVLDVYTASRGVLASILLPEECSRIYCFPRSAHIYTASRGVLDSDTIGSCYDYTTVLQDSLLFYEAQRSGKLPSDQRVTWRKDSALNDKGNDGEDLTGGYYDAGDYVKFGFPMAFTTTVLSWGLLDHENGYQKANSVDDCRKAIKWATDWFLKAHVSANEYYGQVGSGTVDHASWGRPEDMTMERPAFKITTSAPGQAFIIKLTSGASVYKDDLALQQQPAT
uniref:cellulase n=1 Tax=Timema poppense TaxID=170557 RepID=A0A7R9CPI5_TIMPO|nr:unnamed protein product [Timema poppensis]